MLTTGAPLTTSTDRPTARLGTLFGAVVAATAASACCLGPLVFAALGLGGAGMWFALEPYRPVLALATVALLALGFVQTYGPLPRVGVAASSGEPLTRALDGGADVSCDCPTPTARRAGAGMLWLVTVVALLALAFPYLASFLA